MRSPLAAVLLALVWLEPTPVRAACSGASIDQDYREADIVARARVVAETRAADDELSPAYRARWGDYSPIMLHRLRVLQIFKGLPVQTVNLFQEVASGRFDVDMGQEYLLFLHRYPPTSGLGSAARGAMYVRYACGQSKRWEEVRVDDLARLRILSLRR